LPPRGLDAKLPLMQKNISLKIKGEYGKE